MSFKSAILDAIRTRLRFPKNHRSVTVSDDDEEDHIVWDEPDPFGTPDPSLAYLRVLLQAEIARVRQYESIGPLDTIDDTDSDEDDGDDHDENEDQVSDNESERGDVHDYDGDADCEDNDTAEFEFTPIRLPRLLNIPLRIPSPSPPPSNTDWADLAQAYNNIADDHERVLRKEKRDAHRALLGSASAAL